MKKHIIFLLAITVLFTSCYVDYDLEKSVFIEDSEFEGLPIYSEWGYNTFGAYYDRKAFVSNNEDIPLKIISTDNTTTFIFKGELLNTDEYPYSRYNEGDMLMKLIIENLEFGEYSDLTILNKTKYNLLNSDLKISIDIDGEFEDVEIIDGEFEFVKAQFLLVDNEQKGLILSGLFDFKFLINDEPISISHGRFDMNVNEEVFFSF